MINLFPYTNFHEINLDWILKNMKKLVEEVNKLDEWVEQNQGQYNDLIDIVNSLQEQIQAIENGNFPPEMINAISVWLLNNIGTILATIIWFGVSENGYLIAYIPESWSDILFVTPMNYDQDDYGRLCLYYNIEKVEKELLKNGN